MHKNVKSFDSALNHFLKNNGSLNEISIDQTSKKRGNKLKYILEKVYEDEEYIKIENNVDSQCQTDITGENILIDRIYRMKTTLSETERNLENNFSDSINAPQTTSINSAVGEKGDIETISKLFEMEVKIKKLMQFPKQLSRSSKSPREELHEKEESKVVSRFIDQFRINKYMPKITSVAEEFLLGKINRKICLVHPGQKLLRNVMKDIKDKQKIQNTIGIKVLMKIINNLYMEKTLLCRESSTHKRDEVCTLLYDMLINRYGLRNVAEKKFGEVIVASLIYSENNIRIKNFLQFLGITGDYSVSD